MWVVGVGRDGKVRGQGPALEKAGGLEEGLEG